MPPAPIGVTTDRVELCVAAVALFERRLSKNTTNQIQMNRFDYEHEIYKKKNSIQNAIVAHQTIERKKNR